MNSVFSWQDLTDAYGQVYRALDEVWIARGMPADCIGMVHKAIQHLRSTKAPDSDIELAERIAVVLYRIESTRRSSDSDAEILAREELQSLGHAWMNRRIRTPRFRGHA